jgi:hypothetical protein
MDVSRYMGTLSIYQDADFPEKPIFPFCLMLHYSGLTIFGEMLVMAL